MVLGRLSTQVRCYFWWYLVVNWPFYAKQVHLQIQTPTPFLVAGQSFGGHLLLGFISLEIRLSVI